MRSQEVFNCDKCEFETKSEKGLNIHNKRKHPINTVCEICEKRFNSPTDFKMYTYTHSYTLVKLAINATLPVTQ